MLEFLLANFYEANPSAAAQALLHYRVLLGIKKVYRFDPDRPAITFLRLLPSRAERPVHVRNWH